MGFTLRELWERRYTTFVTGFYFERILASSRILCFFYFESTWREKDTPLELWCLESGTCLFDVSSYRPPPKIYLAQRSEILQGLNVSEVLAHWPSRSNKTLMVPQGDIAAAWHYALCLFSQPKHTHTHIYIYIHIVYKPIQVSNLTILQNSVFWMNGTHVKISGSVVRQPLPWWMVHLENENVLVAKGKDCVLCCVENSWTARALYAIGYCQCLHGDILVCSEYRRLALCWWPIWRMLKPMTQSGLT